MKTSHRVMLWWCAIYTVAYLLFFPHPEPTSYFVLMVLIPCVFIFLMRAPMFWVTAMVVGVPMLLFGDAPYLWIGLFLTAAGAISGWSQHCTSNKEVGS